jgi:oligoendopeptidase F
MEVNIPERAPRKFIPEELTIESWETIKPYFDKLLERNPQTPEELKQWFADRSELGAALSENMGWRYIKMTCDTDNEELQQSFDQFVQEISPRVAPISNQLNKKALENKALKQINESGYPIMIRDLEKDVRTFREENIPLNTKMQIEQKKFGQINGAMTVEVKGQELTLQQAANYLMSSDRALREEVYRKVQDRRLQDKEVLDELFNTLIKLRDEVARNADFENYRDYMFVAKGRFDYKPEDCFAFHNSVAKAVVPILDQLALERKEKLGVERLRPWDKKVEPSGAAPLKPFETGEELTDKGIEVFRRVDEYLGSCLATMKAMGHLDLESRKGKAPGGYNYPLMEIGVPFIFMNATSNLRDMVTLMHEGGHAVHSFLTRDLELADFKNTPSEVAELASMAMELISMDHWDVFFPDPEDLRRAKKEHLAQVIDTLPWVATIDKFQHWIYENPEHSNEERVKAWNDILDTFSDTITDWNGLEEEKNYMWQKQLHLYEVPFYYIEYGFAQLGAIAVWKNYKEDPQKGLEGYINALKLGYTKNIPEIYRAANIHFDFSSDYIQELMTFVQDEINKL